MFAIENGKMLHFHCNVGHAYSPESLSEAHTEALERAIWIAIRALRERSAIQESLSKGYRATEKEMAARLKATAKAADRDADLLEEILERL
jgi:two-component system chemotaxis response regulator CheB